MANCLVIIRNGVESHRFDKREGLARMQFAYVQRLDADMDRGVDLDGERVLCPDLAQRVRFVLGRLAAAVNVNDSQTVALLCRWLAQRAPDLDVIRIEEAGDEYRVELEYGNSGAD